MLAGVAVATGVLAEAELLVESVSPTASTTAVFTSGLAPVYGVFKRALTLNTTEAPTANVPTGQVTVPEASRHPGAETRTAPWATHPASGHWCWVRGDRYCAP